jgi:hypothetical protein
MAFTSWPHGIQLCFDFVTAGQNWQFCLALRKSAGDPNVTDLQTVADQAASWWTNSLKQYVPAETTLRQTRATDMTVSGGPVRLNAINSPGTQSGDPVTNNAALVVSGRTEKRGRSYRGRSYISGLDKGSLTDAANFSSVYAAHFPTVFAVLQATLDTYGFDVGVISKQHDGVPTNPAEFNEVVAYSADTKVDSQRRRLSGRGT